MKKDIVEKQIKEEWFKDHVAEFERLSDRISVIDWGKPNSSFYYCRYVIDGSRLYISGDIGEAVFRFTEIVSLEKLSKYDLHYFHSKLSAFCEDKYSFNSDIAQARIKEEIEEVNENLEVNDEGLVENFGANAEIINYTDALNSLVGESDNCYTKSGWEFEVNQKYDELSDYSPDIAEWIFKAGDVIPSRVQGYLIGLKMALEQLKTKGVIA